MPRVTLNNCYMPRVTRGSVVERVGPAHSCVWLVYVCFNGSTTLPPIACIASRTSYGTDMDIGHVNTVPLDPSNPFTYTGDS